MSKIVIEIPVDYANRHVEVEVRIDGKVVKDQYRVETFPFNQAHDGNAHYIDQLRDLIESFDPEWVLYHIGLPTAGIIPVTFRKRRFE